MHHLSTNLRAALVVTSAAVALSSTGCGQAPNTGGAGLVPGGRSWMSAAAQSSTLLYVSRASVNVVSILSYPRGKQVGELTGFEGVWGLCADRQGNVFVVDAEAQKIFEYAHGGTSPISTLDDTGNAPNGCAVDPSSGNLAVAGGSPTSNIPANIAIYAGARGAPTVYPNAAAHQYIYCTYDGGGNVFAVDVYTKMANAAITELPSGSGTYRNFSLQGQFFAGAHSIQWDGTYLAVVNATGNNMGPTHLDQVQISGSNATIANSLKLTDAKDTADPFGSQIAIHGGTIVYPQTAQNLIGLWHYPAGNKAYSSVKVGAGDVFGLALSLAQ